MSVKKLMSEENQEIKRVLPITKPKRSTDITPTTESIDDSDKEGSPLFFQAIGIISGVVDIDEENKNTTLTISGNKYPLYYIASNKGLRALDALKKHVANNGNHQRLIVYPRVTHFPGRDKPHQISFQLVGFDPGDNKGMCDELKDLEFKLSGIWQFIPVCQVPCISIFKNFTEDRLEYVKKSDISKRVKYMKASHIPLFWRDAPVPPFRFNPRVAKEQQGRAYFVSIIAKFLPQKNAFGFESLTQMPLEEPPKFFKASKKMKAEALSLRKKEPAPQNEAAKEQEAIPKTTSDSSKFSMPQKRSKPNSQVTEKEK
ncbi:hypothetical protein NIES4071_01430 [Calothrix sp. NIES-4071]|nr:hypothetical protein NIES4071_01430 [Calothrix sp. NIES-4071]BAZ54489.1 hypothetical protein NIES4105_01420 [Calothrix sp. NIES-4105]